MIRCLTLPMAGALLMAAPLLAQPAAAPTSVAPTTLAQSAATQPLATQPPGAPPGQTEFVPLSELPPNEQLPAAPLLVTAYAVFLILMVFYVWTVWVRLNKVETEMHALEQRVMKHSR